MARVHGGGAQPAPAGAPTVPQPRPEPAHRPPPAVRGARVVLVRDARRPPGPRACCWRYAVREAFAAAGATVTEADWTAPDSPDESDQPDQPNKRYAQDEPGGPTDSDKPDESGEPSNPPTSEESDGPRRPRVPIRSAPRLAWLPGLVRRPLVRAYRGFGRGRRLLAGRRQAARARRHAAGQRQVLAPALRDATLVVAESAGAAAAAVAAGVPGRRVWALARPISSPGAYPPTPERALAGTVGGFLTGGEPARETVERAVAAHRVRVEVFPPLVPDRHCPACTPPSGATPAPDGSPASGGLPESGGSAAAQDCAARAVLGTVATDSPPRPRPARPTLVSGFDLKFVAELAGHLDDRADLEVAVDEWPTLSDPSARTALLATRAESVLAEWARPSAAWLSRRKRPGQVLVVRLHRYELDFPYPRDVAIDNVDAVVHVSPPIGRRIRDELGWPVEKLVHIPNFVPAGWLDRPKLPGARFGLGLVGMEWRNKRFDLALDLLAEVRHQDPRFALFVRSVMPWDSRYAWSRREEREYAEWCFARIEEDPLLRGAVTFDPPGRDMARWYRRAGHVLSMSDVESFHLTAAEGMASGAVPVIRPWPGAAEIYGAEWIHASIEDAAAAVLADADPDVWAERAARARAEIGRTADPAAVVRAWADLLHGDLAAARKHFADPAPAGPAAPRGPIPHQRPPGA